MAVVSFVGVVFFLVTYTLFYPAGEYDFFLYSRIITNYLFQSLEPG